MNRWLTVRVAGGGIHIYPLGTVDDTALARLVERANVAHAVPPGWLHQPGWDIAVTEQPHPTLIAQATIHDPAELAAVTQPQLDAWRAETAAESKTRRMASADQILTTMDAAELDEFLDRYRPNLGGPTIRPT